MVKKYQNIGLAIHFTELVDVVDHILRHWKDGPPPTCYFFASAEVEKFKQPLDVASRPEAYCANGTSLLGVSWTWFLMCLLVGTKTKMTISLEI